MVLWFAYLVWAVSTHSRLKAAGCEETGESFVLAVSTHSRLKAAGFCCQQNSISNMGFNTQPPEGGWEHTWSDWLRILLVSTHSRLKAAGRK